MTAQDFFSAEGYDNEKQAVEDLRRRVTMSGLFKIYDEVQGKSIGIWHIQQQRRIDMILVPTAAALDAGWKHGFVGIECKRSGKKIDEAMLQAITYMDCVWTLGDWRGLIVLSSVLVWPYYWPKDQGYAQRMQQARVGVAYPTTRDGFNLSVRGAPTVSWSPQAGVKTVLD